MKSIYFFLILFITVTNTYAQKKQYFYKNSNKVQSYGELVDGKKNGEWVFYFPNGMIQAKGNYVMDKPEGKWLMAKNSDPDFMQEVYYKNGNEVIRNEYKAYYSTGELRASCPIINAKFEGIYKEFYKDGKLGVSVTYKQGKREGETLIYYPNGKLRMKTFYQKDKIIGSYEEYWDNGNLKVKSNYIDLGIDGEQIQYWKSGKKVMITNYKNGKKNGNYTRFQDGSIYESGNYTNDLKTGVWVSYDYNNNKVYTRYNQLGKKSGEYKKVYPNGKTAEKGKYVNDKKEGVWNSYYDNGALRSSQSYYSNLREGAHLFYSYKDGEPYYKKTSGYYQRGKKSGKWYTYTKTGAIQKIVKYENDKAMKRWEPINLYVENKRSKKIDLYLTYLRINESSASKNVTLYPNQKKYIGKVLHNDIFYYYKEGTVIWSSRKDNGGPRIIRKDLTRDIHLFKPRTYMYEYNDDFTLPIKE